MDTELVAGPAQFAEQSLGLKPLVVSRIALRQIANPEGGRVGISCKRFKIQEARKIEIAAALWHLMALPNDDVVVAVPFGSGKDAWLTDLTTVLKHATVGTQREIAVREGTLLTRFLGVGRLLFHIAGGKDRAPAGDIQGTRPLLIVAGLDGLPTAQAIPLYNRFAPPGMILGSTYER
jgi:hypothetical protein